MKVTFEEFRELVKNEFEERMPQLDAEQVEEYLNSEDSVGVIKDEYAVSVKQFEKGEITEEQFRIGGASAAAHCLYMLY